MPVKKYVYIDNQVMFIFKIRLLKVYQICFEKDMFLDKPVLRERFNKEFERAMCVIQKKRHKYRIVFKNAVNYLEVKDNYLYRNYAADI